MLNFMSPWMTQYTREKHNGEREPSRNMKNRKPSAGRKCVRIPPLSRSKARTLRAIAGVERHLERHPDDKVRVALLAKLQKRAA